MPNQGRKQRGYDTQRLVADYFRTHGWPYAESTGAGRAGTDVTGMPGIDIEVKATARFEPLAWLKQMFARCTGSASDPDVCAGVWRPNGYGPAKVAEFPVITDLATFAQLLLDAGYGSKCGNRAADPVVIYGDDPALVQDAIRRRSFDADAWKRKMASRVPGPTDAGLEIP